MKAFKIKNKDGLFSTGGYTPRWTKRGKTWGSFQAIKLHLRLFCDYSRGNYENRVYKWTNNIKEDWVVIELSEEGIREYPAKELYPKTEE